MVVHRARLGLYFALEQYRKRKDVKGYLEACGLVVKGTGLECLRTYSNLLSLNSIKVRLSIFFSKEAEKCNWDFEGRWAINLVSLVASTFHWSRAEILDLDVDEFFAYVQDIVVTNQLDREWQYSLTEIAYPYNATTKMNEFKPLKRPEWMQITEIKEPEAPIPQTLVPMGMVLDARSFR